MPRPDKRKMRPQEILDRLTAHRRGGPPRQRRHSWPATEGREKKGIEKNRSGKSRTGQLQLSEKGTNRGLFPPVEGHCLLKKRGLNGILSRSRSFLYVGASHRISKDFRWLSASWPADSPPVHWVVFLVYGRKLFTSVSPLHYLYQHNLESSKKRHTHSRRHTLRTAHTAQERISITVEPRLPGTALNSLAANNAPG